MTVLQVNASYGIGSTGIIVRDIKTLCWQCGLTCYVATCEKSANEEKNIYVIGNILDHKIHALFRRINGKSAYFSTFPTKRFINYIDKIKPDIVHLHNLHNNYINLNLLLQHLANNNIYTIITLHDCWFFTGGCYHFASDNCLKWQQSCGNCPKKHTDIKSIFKDYTSQVLLDRKKFLTSIPHLIIIGASKWVADECRKSILKDCDIRYIHNGFDLNIFKPTDSNLRHQLGLEGKFVILGPSPKWNLPVNKPTYDYFVKHMTDDMVLVLFGGEIKQHTSNKVKEIGYISGQKSMAELYSMADIFVNCSREDTFPGVNMECQACGTPVVTYDATGCKETVDQKCGFAVSTGDYKALFTAMENVKSIGKGNLTVDIQQRIKDNFEMQAAYMKYINLFKEIGGDIK